MKIDIYGWYNMKNVGDDAFALAMHALFEGHDIRFVTPDVTPPSTTPPDIAILGGGAVVSPFYLEAMPRTTSRYAIGVEISYESEADLLAKHNFDGVYIRNKTDIDLLKQKLTCPVHYIPDLSFCLEPLDSNVLPNYTTNKVVGVFLTDYVSPALSRNIDEFDKRHWSFITNLAAKLDYLIEQGYDIIFVPCSTKGYSDDRRINLNIRAFMHHQHKIINILNAFEPEEMMGIISRMDLTVCMRYHGHLFSCIAGTPFLSIAFSRKVNLFLRENNLLDTSCAQFYGDIFDTSIFQHTFHQVRNTDYRSRLKKLTAAKREELLNSFGEIRKTVLDKA